MRSFICQLLAITVLFMSVEGAWDLVKDVTPHSDDLISQVEVDNQMPTDSDPLSDGDGFQCGHLCHGHNSSIPGEHADLIAVVSTHYQIPDVADFSDRSVAPPTPPPNI